MRPQKRGSSAICNSSTTHHCGSSRCGFAHRITSMCVARSAYGSGRAMIPPIVLPLDQPVEGEDTDLEEIGMKVSCICATYNRPPHFQWLLEEAIESFLRQDYAEKELIVLNDCPEQELLCDAP